MVGLISVNHTTAIVVNAVVVDGRRCGFVAMDVDDVRGGFVAVDLVVVEVGGGCVSHINDTDTTFTNDVHITITDGSSNNRGT